MTDRFGQLAFRTNSRQDQGMVDLAHADPDTLPPERRNRIIAGAAAVFMRDGYEGASMSQIAAAAHVSKGTLYNYFPGKEALFAAFVRENCDCLVQEIFQDTPEGLPIEAELARICRTMLRMLLSARGMAIFRVAVMEASKFPELAQAFIEAGPNVMVANMAAWIARQAAAGLLKVDDPEFAAEQFFALSQTRLVMRARTNAAFVASEAEIEQVINGAVRVFLAAYCNPEL
ncbi:MAG TPA: TetR/AcrR family transcriptional regulator [Acidocella sp.]|nr:TetR/AcrR family transcriptional regulator [Acidocella sp.]